LEENFFQIEIDIDRQVVVIKSEFSIFK